MKIKWKVQEAPTGRYRSFHNRGWPIAYKAGDEDEIVAHIYCDDSYVPQKAKSGDHAPLRVALAFRDHKTVGFDWRTFTKPAATLAEAKERVAKFVKANPDKFINKKDA